MLRPNGPFVRQWGGRRTGGTVNTPGNQALEAKTRVKRAKPEATFRAGPGQEAHAGPGSRRARPRSSQTKERVSDTGRWGEGGGRRTEETWAEDMTILV